MITHLKELPETMVGFRAEGEITKEDFDNVVMPAVKKAVERNDELNYMLELDTSIKNFTIGAWVKDAALGIINLSKWHRVAIITEDTGIIKFTKLFSFAMPGEFKGFKPEDKQQAITWVAGKKAA